MDRCQFQSTLLVPVRLWIQDMLSAAKTLIHVSFSSAGNTYFEVQEMMGKAYLVVKSALVASHEPIVVRFKLF